MLFLHNFTVKKLFLKNLFCGLTPPQNVQGSAKLWVAPHNKPIIMSSSQSQIFYHYEKLTIMALCCLHLPTLKESVLED